MADFLWAEIQIPLSALRTAEGEGEITGSFLPLLLGACLHAFRLSAHRIELAGTAQGRSSWELYR
jgi:hypothetical protein